MNDVRGHEMSEITLLSFSKISKIGFLQFAGKLRGVGKSQIIHKMRIQKADILWKFFRNEVGQTTPFFEKIVFFTKYFNSRYLSQLMRYWYQIRKSEAKQTALSRDFFIYSLFWEFDLLRNQKCEIQFSSKKGFFFKISGKVLYYWIQLLNLNEKNIFKKIKSGKWIFSWFLFYLFFIF